MPIWLWVSVSIVMAGWFILISLNRLRSRRQREFESRGSVSYTPDRWEEVDRFTLKGVSWRIRLALWSHSDVSNVTPDDFEASFLPRCPRCETELSERPTFWGGFKWYCSSCGSKKRTFSSYEWIADEADKVARRRAKSLIERKRREEN